LYVNFVAKGAPIKTHWFPADAYGCTSGLYSEPWQERAETVFWLKPERGSVRTRLIEEETMAERGII
jgi:hypothetical protein